MKLIHTMHTLGLMMTHDKDDREIAVGESIVLLEPGRAQPRSMTATRAGVELALLLNDPNHGSGRALMLRGGEPVGPHLS